MSGQQPPATPSAIASLLCCCIAFGSLQVYQEELSSSRFMRVAGGVISSLLFLFLVIFISNVLDSFSREKVGTGWLTVVPCLLAAEAAALSVDPACVYSCFGSSLLLLWYLSKVSVHVHGKYA